MEIKLVDINSIKPNKKNPRVIKDNKFKKLVKSIQEFPEMLNIRPIVVNSKMIVLGGNQRLKACSEAGLTKIPIIIAENLSKEKQDEFILKDNSSFGEWDFESLKANFPSHKLNDWGIEINFSLPSVVEEEQNEAISSIAPSENPVYEMSEEDLTDANEDSENEEQEEEEFYRKINITMFNEDEFDKLKVFLNTYQYAYNVSVK